MHGVPGVALPGAVVALEEVSRVETHVDLEPLLRLEALPALLAVERPPAVRPHVQLQPEGRVARPEADGALVLLREVDEARVPPLGLGILEHLLAILQKRRANSCKHKLFGKHVAID